MYPLLGLVNRAAKTAQTKQLINNFAHSSITVTRRCATANANNNNHNKYLEFSPACDDDVKERIMKNMNVYADFIEPLEESALMEELQPKLNRMRYQFDHWDDVISG